MKTIEQMVQQEVLCCMSSIVSALAQGYGLIQSANPQSRNAARDLDDLTEQAFELAVPVPDYEEAAIQEGWIWDEGGPHFYKPNGLDRAAYFQCEPVGDSREGNWQELCKAESIEPYDWEVYEHWAVTDWFADKLIEQGEKVDKDFGALCIWARTTTGQAISMDGCVQRIYEAMMQPVPA